MEPIILILIVIFAVFIVGRLVSKTKRKISKDTEPLRQKSSYQNPGKSYPQNQPVRSDQQKSSQVAYKTKAQSEAEVKERIRDFPEVKVEHIIDGDTVPKDRQEKINRLERWARSKMVGLWQTPNPIPPWKWRSED